MDLDDRELSNDKERERRDWLIFLLLLLLGFACLLCTAQIAIRQSPTWQASAGMLSELDPDKDHGTEMTPIDPLRPEVMTLPWDPDTILTPRGTSVVVPTMVVGPPATATPTATPQEVAVAPTATPSPVAPSPTRSPTATPTTTPTATETETPTPTITPTATETPPPTPTDTETPVPSPPTNTSAPPPPPTDTPVPPTATATETPTATPTPTSTPIPILSVLSITPDRGVNTAPVPVVITGTNFIPMPTARLGSHALISITAAVSDTLTGTVPAGLRAGVYALTVINPDAQFDILSPAYIALNPPNPDKTLESGFLSIFGSGAPGGEGDDDHVQLIFFEVPDTFSAPLYFRVFDADTGGGPMMSEIDQPAGLYDTQTTYTLYGDGGYIPDARLSHPGAAGISAGVLLGQAVIGADGVYDAKWELVFGPYQASHGQPVGDRRVFKLAVEGGAGNDGNRYHVALSTANDDNITPADSRVFAYSWTFRLTDADHPPMYPYVPEGSPDFEQHNWDADRTGGAMTLHTPMQDIGVPPSAISGDGNEASSSHSVQAEEDGAAWTVMMGFSFSGSWNDLTFWAVGGGTDLAIFTRPTMDPPP
jgi:hypothetical protein